MKSERSRRILREMGLAPLWRLRPSGQAQSATRATGQEAVQPATSAHGHEPAPMAGAAQFPAAPGQISRMGWDELRQAVAGCRACGLCSQRKQAVLGVGDVNAEWLFIGEAPGAEEDERGEPFVGQAGKLLDSMLAAIGLRRGANVYIANTVKCRPPNNRTPEPEETAACFPYLARQIALIQPRLIVALGRPAAQTLLAAEVKIGASRGRLFEHQGVPMLITYHPAYLLRNLTDKSKSWEDLCFARSTMRQLQSR